MSKRSTYTFKHSAKANCVKSAENLGDCGRNWATNSTNDRVHNFQDCGILHNCKGLIDAVVKCRCPLEENRVDAGNHVAIVGQ